MEKEITQMKIPIISFTIEIFADVNKFNYLFFHFFIQRWEALKFRKLNFHCVKVSVFGAILVRIFPHSAQMRENADQNNSKYGHFLCSVKKVLSVISRCWFIHFTWKQDFFFPIHCNVMWFYFHGNSTKLASFSVLVFPRTILLNSFHFHDTITKLPDDGTALE